jgi:hypothetical protein
MAKEYLDLYHSFGIPVQPASRDAVQSPK